MTCHASRREVPDDRQCPRALVARAAVGAGRCARRAICVGAPGLACIVGGDRRCSRAGRMAVLPTHGDRPRASTLVGCVAGSRDRPSRHVAGRAAPRGPARVDRTGCRDRARRPEQVHGGGGPGGTGGIRTVARRSASLARRSAHAVRCHRCGAPRAVVRILRCTGAVGARWRRGGGRRRGRRPIVACPCHRPGVVAIRRPTGQRDRAADRWQDDGSPRPHLASSIAGRGHCGLRRGARRGCSHGRLVGGGDPRAASCILEGPCSGGGGGRAPWTRARSHPPRRVGRHRHRHGDRSHRTSPVEHRRRHTAARHRAARGKPGIHR